MKKTALFLAMAAALLSGCASTYRFGKPLPEQVRKLAIPVLKSAVTQAEVEAVVTQMLRREVIRDGSFKLVGADEANVIWEGEITRYTLKPVRYLDKTSGTPIEYRVIIAAKASLRSAGGDTIVVPEFTREAETTTVVRDDLPTAKSAVLQRVSQALARSLLLEAVTRLTE